MKLALAILALELTVLTLFACTQQETDEPCPVGCTCTYREHKILDQKCPPAMTQPAPPPATPIR